MSNSAQNFQLFACGRKGSGKDHLISQIGRRFPRRLILDTMGQHSDTPAAVVTWTLGETMDALRSAARRERWAIAAVLGAEDCLTVLNCIAPPKSNPKESFAYKVGGLVLESGEVDQLAPSRGMDAAMTGVLARGRHYRISTLFGARRPFEVARLLTSQCDVLAAFQQHEADDIDYLARTATSDIRRYLSALRADYEYVRFLTKRRRLSIIGANGRERQP